MRPSISAVLCTYNRRVPLMEALSSIVNQDVPRHEYEIIVVDNGSTDGTADHVRERFGSLENLRLIPEPRLGVAIARNRGARECRSNIAAYLDDDALAPPDYLSKYLEIFSRVQPTPAIAGGEMAPIFGASRPSWLSDSVLRWASSHLGWSTEPCYLKADGTQWLCETNSAYRVDALFQAGGFPENLGRVGDSLLSSEGHVNTVLHHAGFPSYYDPSIVVRHHVPAERMTQSWFRRRAFWQGVSSAISREYLMAKGIADSVFRPLSLPCTPEEWVSLFDDHVPDEAFPETLHSLVHLGYVLGTQNLLRGR